MQQQSKKHKKGEKRVDVLKPIKLGELAPSSPVDLVLPRQLFLYSESPTTQIELNDAVRSLRRMLSPTSSCQKILYHYEELAGCIFVKSIEVPTLTKTTAVLVRGLNECNEQTKRRILCKSDGQGQNYRMEYDWQTSSSENGLRAHLLPLSRQLALQPELILKKYEPKDAFYYARWCRDREPDFAKRSFYVNLIDDDPANGDMSVPEKYPSGLRRCCNWRMPRRRRTVSCLTPRCLC